MSAFIWKETRYNLFIHKWGIAIILKAGYKILAEMENRQDVIKIAEDLYFYPSLQSWSKSQQLIEEEILCFCEGLKLVCEDILKAVRNRLCLITLQTIHFSACNIQNEAFTACAIQWASEIFGFPMPEVKVAFDSTEPPYGRYIYDFSNKL